MHVISLSTGFDQHQQGVEFKRKMLEEPLKKRPSSGTLAGGVLTSSEIKDQSKSIYLILDLCHSMYSFSTFWIGSTASYYRVTCSPSSELQPWETNSMPGKTHTVLRRTCSKTQPKSPAIKVIRVLFQVYPWDRWVMRSTMMFLLSLLTFT